MSGEQAEWKRMLLVGSFWLVLLGWFLGWFSWGVPLGWGLDVCIADDGFVESAMQVWRELAVRMMDLRDPHCKFGESLHHR